MLSGLLPPLVIRGIMIYIILINLAALFLFGLDKYRAKNRRRRIRERTLLLSAILGGSVGALFGMLIYHHKTRHRKFTIGVPVILFLQIVLICVVLLILKK